MNVIEKILYQKDSVSVVFNNGVNAIITYSLLNSLVLNIGGDVSDEIYNTCIRESVKFSCRNSAFRYLSIRSHSTGEIRIKLKKKGFDETAINEVISEMTDYGYLDDYDFAKKFIRDKTRKKVIGERLIRQKLFLRGISREIIDSAITDEDCDNIDYERLCNVARKKLVSIKKREGLNNRLASFLYRRGFGSDSIRKVMKLLKNDGYLD